MTGDSFVSIAEACRMLSISRSSLYRLVRRGEMEGPRPITPGRVGLLRSKLEGYIKSKAAAPPTVRPGARPGR